MGKRIVAVVGTYRKGGLVDALVSELLGAAEAQGAETCRIYLLDKHIEFCANCRQCTQTPGPQRGRCARDDEMDAILTDIESADGVVLASPVNFFNVTAITRRFIERLVCYAYWPWGTLSPKPRSPPRDLKAVLVTASAMPAFLGKIFTSAPRALRLAAKLLGARPIACIYAGLAAASLDAAPPAGAIRAARAAGRKLAL